LGLYFLLDFRSRCCSRLHKFPSLITNVLLQLVRDITIGVCYQRHEKRLEEQKDHPDVNVCAAEENLEEEL